MSIEASTSEDATLCSDLLKLRVQPILNAAIERAADSRLQSKSEYVRTAVIDRLKADGIDPSPAATPPTVR